LLQFVPIADVAQCAAQCRLFRSARSQRAQVVFLEVRCEFGADIFSIGPVQLEPRKSFANELSPVEHIRR